MLVTQTDSEKLLQVELPGRAVAQAPAHGVVLAADAENGHRHLVHVPQGVIALPVGVPALRLAEQGLLQLPQRPASEETLQGQHFPQGGGKAGEDHRTVAMEQGQVAELGTAARP
uniref:Uncharacterized protein n=1 Tax=Apteryx owenii TaxID=8824 RepID=A0A8B9Q2R6_APTOW